MQKEAYKKRCKEEFKLGDLVYLKLQPYRQCSLTAHRNEKLSPRFFGPYKITERGGIVAYCLKLPNTMPIHPMFHVS